jgi:serine/threonine-protein kinase RsbT
MASLAFNTVQDVCVPVASEHDLVTARREGRGMAAQLGFSACEATLVATAISELIRNIFIYASQGEIHLSLSNDNGKNGITVVAVDQGARIADIDLAARVGYSAAGGMGLGLPGVKRIMDEFDIAYDPGRGTAITVTKWKRQ